MLANPHLGVILAGGQSRRMGGGDKTLLRLTDHRILDLVIARLSPQVRAMALNANGAPDRFADTGLRVLPDPLPDFPGPLAGVLAAMEWAAAKGAPSVITVAADTPFFPADLVAKLDQAARNSGFSLAATGAKPDWHPVFGLWPVRLRDTLRRDLQEGQRKVIDWARRHGAEPALFTDTPDPFFNINTPEDLALARERHAAR